MLPAEDYEANCAFTDFANWLIPGRVMLGRYPFVEPSRCRSRDVGEEQLRQLLNAGITVFVSLQVGAGCWDVAEPPCVVSAHASCSINQPIPAANRFHNMCPPTLPVRRRSRSRQQCALAVWTGLCPTAPPPRCWPPRCRRRPP